MAACGGFDTLYNNAWHDADLAEIASAGDKRILLTRDYGLLKRKKVTQGYFIRNDNLEMQVREVLSRFHLYQAVQPFSRCTQCNGLIQPVDKDQMLGRLPHRVAEVFDQFSACVACQRVYWQGSHFEHMRRIIDGLLSKEVIGD